MADAYVETFGEIVDDVLLDRFEAAKRPRARRAVNSCYKDVWALEDWSFAYALANLTTTGSAPALGGLPANFGVPLMLWDDGGSPVPFVDAGAFQTRYLTGGTGSPEAYTVVGGSILVGPTPAASASWTCWYRKRLTPLVSESDVPEIPVEFRVILVHGGRSELLEAYNDPTADSMEARFQKDLQAMQREYLTDAEGQPSRWGSDPTPVGGGWGW